MIKALSAIALAAAITLLMPAAASCNDHRKTETQQPPEELYAAGCQFVNAGKYEKALKAFKQAAEMGDAESQYRLASMYYYGIGTKRNYAKAAELYLKAAESGYVYAQREIGEMYAEGLGVPWDYDKAVMWYAKAAEQGHAHAQYLLGTMYENGRGVEINDSIAAELYLKAAEQDHVRAQFKLSEMYATGKGLPKDMEKAGYWLEKATQSGYPFPGI